MRSPWPLVAELPHTLGARIVVMTVTVSMLATGAMGWIDLRERRDAYQEQSHRLVEAQAEARQERLVRHLSTHRDPLASPEALREAGDNGVSGQSDRLSGEWHLAPVAADGSPDLSRTVGTATWVGGASGLTQSLTDMPRPDAPELQGLHRIPQPPLDCWYPDELRHSIEAMDGSGGTVTTTRECAPLVVTTHGFAAAPPGLPPQRWVLWEFYQPWGTELSPWRTQDPLAAARRSLARAGAAAVLLSAAAALVLARRVQRPVVETRRVAEAVAAGDRTARVRAPGGDDLGRMGSAVNAMADTLTAQIDELTAAEQRQRRFTSDVAHELRTPTASLLAAAAALEDPATREAAAVRLAPALRRLTSLTEDLLEVSRIDAGHAPVRRDRVDLQDLAREVAQEVGGVEVLGVAVVADVDPVRTRVALVNLVRNAVTHGRHPVTVTVGTTPAEVVLVVRDAGDGVPAGLRPKVFDRFVRGDASRHGDGSSSSGLGLAIARENARLQGGDITLDEDGRTFRVRLPR